MTSRLLDVADGRSGTVLAMATIAIATVTHQLLAHKKPRVIPSPLKTVLPYLSPEELLKLDYTPDMLPGARDVDTPYGSIRVYEWGPKDGPRVLFIHGISTPCVILSKVAQRFVDRGYRVMLFDLFGRGYSDGVRDIPHDAALYVTQAMYALTSSPLSWTGAQKLRVVGYSLGGGIAVNFASAFPQLVKSLVLFAPSGMIRPASFGLQRHIFTSGLIPETLLAYLTSLRLQTPLSAKKNSTLANTTEGSMSEKADAGEDESSSRVTDSFIDIGAAEIQPVAGEEDAPLDVRMRRYVPWMVKNHAGFVPAFMSCVRNAPLADQSEAYAKIAKRPKNSTLVLLARDDEIILEDEFRADALPLMGGEEHVKVMQLPGGHDFVVTQESLVVKAVLEEWDEALTE
ncbi:hypothetical protein BROUX41_005457 [Berkeleyomyces rouxiae]|uniref:uncharacterized protein n=1 Tax=Berkeleyomyces rouxiae TaxID=2035830 RepID=UPI003B822516